MLQVSLKNPAKISCSWTLEGLAYIQMANAPDMHPSLRVWCVHLQLASSTQIHWTTTSIVSYLHYQWGRVVLTATGWQMAFPSPPSPRQERREKKKNFRTALNGTDCEADPGISNSECISYIKSWISSEYDSMHIHFKL